MNQLPNLAGVATANLVEAIGTGKFRAEYINWSRTLHLLRTHAPGWLPELVPNDGGGLLHAAPVGAYVMVRFRNGDSVTPAVPHAIMDSRNAAIPLDKITARDITDSHRRGICLAAALTFGLGYELWAKLPMESGHTADDGAMDLVSEAAAAAADGTRAYVDFWGSLTNEQKQLIGKASHDEFKKKAKEADQRSDQ